MKLPLSTIALDHRTQTRAVMNSEVISDYAYAMVNEAVFPPLVIYQVGDKNILVDGFHRFHAAEKAQFTEIECEVHQGTIEDAIKFALKANFSHGLRRTNEDKRRTVIVALETFPDWSNRLTAESCGVSDVFVASVRNQLQTVSSCTEQPEPKRLGKDGKLRSTEKSVERDAFGDPVEEEEKPRVHAGLADVADFIGGAKQETKEWNKVSSALGEGFHTLMRKNPEAVRKLARHPVNTIQEAGRLVFGHNWKVDAALRFISGKVGDDTKVKELVTRCIAAGGTFTCTLSGHTITVTKPNGY